MKNNEVFVDSSMSTFKDSSGKTVAVNVGKCHVTDRDGKELYFEVWDTPRSNNFFEARAIYLAAKYFLENKIYNGVIYSDSQTARAWFNNGKVGKVKYNQTEIEEMIHHYTGMKTLMNFELKMWDTKTNGENPADYGNK